MFSCRILVNIFRTCVRLWRSLGHVEVCLLTERMLTTWNKYIISFWWFFSVGETIEMMHRLTYKKEFDSDVFMYVMYLMESLSASDSLSALNLKRRQDVCYYSLLITCYLRYNVNTAWEQDMIIICQSPKRSNGSV